MTTDQFAKSANCSDLIARLEKAEAGSRELDLEIWGNYVAVPRSPRPWKLNVTPPVYTTSLDAITALIGEKLPGWVWTATSGGWFELDRNDAVLCEISSTATTPPLAACAALLRALRAKEGEHG